MIFFMWEKIYFFSYVCVGASKKLLDVWCNINCHVRGADVGKCAKCESNNILI